MPELSKDQIEKIKYSSRILDADFEESKYAMSLLEDPSSMINSTCLTAYLKETCINERIDQSLFEDFEYIIISIQSSLNAHLIFHKNFNEQELEEDINDDIESFQDIDEAFDEASYRRMVEIAKPIVKLAFDDQENEILINAFRIKE